MSARIQLTAEKQAVLEQGEGLEMLPKPEEWRENGEEKSSNGVDG